MSRGSDAKLQAEWNARLAAEGMPEELESTHEGLMAVGLHRDAAVRKFVQDRGFDADAEFHEKRHQPEPLMADAAAQFYDRVQVLVTWWPWPRTRGVKGQLYLIATQLLEAPGTMGRVTSVYLRRQSGLKHLSERTLNRRLAALETFVRALDFAAIGEDWGEANPVLELMARHGIKEPK